MKKTILSLSMLAGLAVSVYAQGVLGSAGSFSSNPAEYGSFTLDNTANTGANDTVVNNGLVYLGATVGTATLLQQDVNIAVYDGTTLVVSLLLDVAGDGVTTGQYPNGAASGDGTAYGGGVFVDNNSTTYFDTLRSGGATASLTLDMWTGDYSTYAAALTHAGNYAGTVSFSEALGNAPATPSDTTPVDFTSMPALVLLPTSVPEPTTIALATLGGLSLLALRRRKSA